jgi:CRISPR-associated endonuclease/helicase Cas3
MDTYYQKLKEKIAGDESDKNLAFMANLQFADLYKSFRLINNTDYDRKDVFVEIDHDAQKVWKRYNNLSRIKNLYDRKNEFLKFKKDFYDYVISIPEKYVPEKEYGNTGIVHIPNDAIDSCYDEQTGWKRGVDDGGCYVL